MNAVETVWRGATVAAVDPETGTVVLWNGSATFNVYAVQGDAWSEVDCFTRYGDDGNACTVSAALAAGDEYLSERGEE